MPKLPSLKPKEVIRALQKAEFKIDRIKGSHYQLAKDNLRVTVPYHNKDISIGLLKIILKQSNMTFDDFKKFL
jgi:predicted RNA binding protein YcfA (HicA-like mRNA interferase family)